METLPVIKSSTHCEDNFIHIDHVRTAQQDLIDGLTATFLARTFQALSDPTRVRLISALSHTDLCVCDLAAVLGMTQSAISHQLSSLRDLRLVKSHKVGREVFYTLDDEHIRELYQLGLDHIQHA
jgi:DNA-binding transcriptional ArsR family regulator